jgi:hypothetical protein
VNLNFFFCIVYLCAIKKQEQKNYMKLNIINIELLEYRMNLIKIAVRDLFYKYECISCLGI